MDSQGSGKINPSVHENHRVLCRKCGWPFPNPHPSAKNRRAHKRICGTIEGYKSIDSEENTQLPLSDDEHLSDEYHKTPSPEILKRNQSGSSGVEERSNRSEDDVFSDAVTEFPDAGPNLGKEELLGSAKESVFNAEKLDGLSATQSIKGSNFTEIIRSPDGSASSPIQTTEVSASSSNQLQSTTLSQGHVPRSNIISEPSSISHSGNKNSVVVPSDDNNGSTSDLYPIIPGTSTDPPQKYMRSIETSIRGNEVNNLEESLLDISVSPNEHAWEISDAGLKAEEMNRNNSDPMTADGIVPLKKEQSDGSEEGLNVEELNGNNLDPMTAEEINGNNLDPMTAEGIVSLKKEQSDGSPDEHAWEISEAGLNAAEISENNLAADGTVLLKKKQSDGSGTKISPSVLSPEVESVIPIDTLVDSADIQLDTAQSSDFAGGCQTRGGGDESVHMLLVPDVIPIVDHPSIMVEDFNDHKALKFNQPVTLDSSEAIKGKEDNVRDPEENCSNFQSSQWAADDGSSSLDVHALEDKKEDGGSELIFDEVSFEQEAGIQKSKDTNSEIILSDELGSPADIEKSLAVCPLEEQEPKDNCNDLDILPEEAATILSNVNPIVDAEVNQVINLISRDGAGDDEKARTEGAIEKTKTNDSADDLGESQSNEKTNSLGSDDVGDDVRFGDKKCDIDGNGSAEGSTVENLNVDISASSLSEDQVTEGGMDHPLDTESAHLDRASDSNRVGINMSHLTETYTNTKNFEEGLEDLEITSNSKVEVECVGTVAESHNAGDIGFLEKTSETQTMKEPLISPEDAKSLVDIDSEKLQKESDNNLSKQQRGVSVDSSCQTGSLERNWSSVSDTQAMVDEEEALAKTGSDTERAKPSEKSDIFESPSFMTLVEPRTSEIQKETNSASLQAGWFPSLTHVTNDSQGRRKNEEIIAKVTNWNSGKQHTPLKSLLSEATSPISEKAKGTSPVVKKNNAVEGEEWKSPARYPAHIKREKRKGKLSWVQFVCCSSVN